MFDRNAAPEGLESLSRYGSDVIVVWDAADAATDVNLRAAFSIARCIAVQESVVDTTKKGERVAIELVLAREGVAFVALCKHRAVGPKRVHGAFECRAIEQSAAMVDIDCFPLSQQITRLFIGLATDRQ